MERVTLHSEGTPLCSFKSAASVPIRSLKAHFTPIQNGSGDPSPSNVREIVGRTSLDIYTTEQDLFENVSIKPNCYRDYNGVEHTSVNSYYTTTMFDIDPSDYELYYMIIYNPTSTVISSMPLRVYFLTENGEWIARIDYEIGGIGANSYGNFSPLGQFSRYPTCRKVQFQFNNAYTIDNFRFIKVSAETVIFPSSSKNRLDASTGWINNQNYEANTGRVLTNGGVRDNKYTAVIPGKTYTMSWSTYGYDMRVVFYRLNDAGNKVATRTLNSTNQSGFTFTVADDECFIRVSHKTGSYTDIPAGLQLELGSTATAYEAYSSDNTFYGGYVDPVKGIIISNWRIIDLGEQAWTKTTQNGYTFFWCTIPDGPLVDSPRGICSHYKNSTSTTMAVDKSIRPYGTTLYGGFSRVAIRDDTYINNTDAEFKEFMSGVMYAYESTVDDEFPLDSVSLYSFEGRNYVFSSSHKEVEVDYDLFETKMIQDAKKRSLAYNQPHLESQTGSIVSFTPQVRAPIKELKCEFQPIQDLHGYDYPWPAGGGKNIMPHALAGSITSNGITVTSDGKGQYFISGTATSLTTITFDLVNTFTIPVSISHSGTGCFYLGNSFSSADTKFHFLYNGAEVDFWACYPQSRITYNYAVMGNKLVNGISFKFPEGFTSPQDAVFTPYITNNNSYTEDFTPYENVCPIEGRINANIYTTGKVIARWNYTISGNNVYSTTVGNSSEAGLAILDILNTLKPGMYNWGMKYETIGTTQARGFRIKYTDATTVNFNMVLRSGSGYATGSIEIPENIKNKTVEYIIGYFGQDSEGHVMESASISDLIIVSTNDTPIYGDERHGAITPVEFPATKNLFDQSQLLQASGFSINSDGYYYGTWGQFSIAFGRGFPKQPSFVSGVRYTVSLMAYTNSDTTNRVIIDFNYTDGTKDRLSIIGITPTKYSMISAAGKIVSSISGTFGSGANNNIYIKDMQVESGVTATPYEPYGTIYGGYIDPIRGVAVSAFKRIVLDGSNYSIYVGDYRMYDRDVYTDRFITDAGILSQHYSSSSMYCISDVFRKNDYAIWSNPDSWPWGITCNGNQIHFTIANNACGITSGMDKDERTELIKAWLAENKPQIVVPLKTPIEYQLTPTQLKAFKDQNNIWSDLNGNTTVKYWTH